MARRMKDSGIECLGEFPYAWEFIPLKYRCILNEKNLPETTDNDFTFKYVEIGDVTLENGIENVQEVIFSQAPSRARRIAKENDIIISTVRTYLKAIAVIPKIDNIVVSTGFAVITPQNINPEFLGLFLKSDYFIQLVSAYSCGVSYPAITSSQLVRFKILCPDIEEQGKIANFLKTKISAIDKVISTTLKTIDDYGKYKQSIITEAVTKGLSRDVKMKDSGIGWIGTIPENWGIIKIRHASWLKGRIGWQGLKSSEYTDSGPYLITGTDFCNGFINWGTCVHISKERYEEAPDIHIREDDLLITKDGTIGKVAIARDCPNEVSLNSGVLLIRNTGRYKYYDKYLYYVLLSDIFWKWYENSQAGHSTIRHLYQEQFYDFPFTYPPLDTQKKISEFLNEKCECIDKLISEKEALIEDLKSYRSSIIYEYVTGKKEV